MAELLDDITYTVSNAVATITICRESKRNALARRHFERLSDLMRAANEDAGVSVIVLTGAGDRAFCAGADLSPGEGFLHSLGDKSTTGLGDYLRYAAGVSKPIVGRINGHCYAGGIGLVASCDFAIACQEARFCLPEVGHGIFPFVVLAALEGRIAHRIGIELALTAQPVTAGRALEIALVSSIVPRVQLDVTVATLVEGLAEHSRETIAFGLSQSRHACIDRYRERITSAEARIREFLYVREGP